MRKRLLLIPLEDLTNPARIEEFFSATKLLNPDFAFIMLSLQDPILALIQKQAVQRLLEDTPSDHGDRCIYFGRKSWKRNNYNLTVEDSFFFLFHKDHAEQTKTIIPQFRKRVSEETELSIVLMATPLVLRNVAEKLIDIYSELDYSYAEDIDELLMEPASKN